MNQQALDQFWQAYLESNPTVLSTSDYAGAVQFGDYPDLANELGQLVLKGNKTATCSALWEWEAAAEEIPKVGLKRIVIDGANNPLCVIETTEVKLCPFNQVDAQFAADEGEGDCTLSSWRREHWTYFSRVLPEISQQPTPEMPLVCERFRVIFS
ncbi:ASCH domain-containing protein [Synechococcus sp. PCC 6312]|uniref:ASCH domain-containing protein n=1 Tax=Synechococcus sp. (strain ATCC 27167 / PCC 6312) TaxID=195253 RepID=UPI00029ECD04|nr:ASCH domain-containing protein [Synechococcus sp. PCC 6312]AFY59393.1 hypothetical protein Syn6312_0140 [Synechococcus sp. PCC 6312]